ncbi:MAG: GTP pyrophosphokinase [Bacteroidetes bacterium]|nr:MAG: GTP pyrophosphokinase [Bacteroidota bacterium]
MGNKEKNNDLRQVRAKYRQLLSACRPFVTGSNSEILKDAFTILLKAYRNNLKIDSEPYFLHAVDVACIVASEMRLGVSSVAAALLHDVDLNILEKEFTGPYPQRSEIVTILQSLSRINNLPTDRLHDNAGNFISLLLSLSGDVRAVLVKLADRLHRMRTIALLSGQEQSSVALETSNLYAPLAHRLGLYKINSELNELSLHYTDPESYNRILSRIQQAELDNKDFFKEFLEPVRAELTRLGLHFTIKNRTKSVSSVYSKMNKQQVSFDEVYDLFAIRVILSSEPENEKADCWKAYSAVTNLYTPETKRLRDWISVPRPNGYESLHVTVLGPTKRWIEVQIRTVRMDEEAELGNAAHWRYKGQAGAVETDEWLNSIRKILENPEEGEEALSSGSKPGSQENMIYVFTPDGDLKKLKTGSTVLDFAFEVHTNLGAKCSGARVNRKIVPLKHQLKNGDMVEIMTSRNQTPNIDWLGWVATSRAKIKIRRYLKEAEFKQAEAGKEIFKRKLSQLKLQNQDDAINKLIAYFKLSGPLDLFQQLAENKIEPSAIKDVVLGSAKEKEEKSDPKPPRPLIGPEVPSANKTSENVIIVNETSAIEGYTLARCCNPVMGDDIFGFITVGDGIKIHRLNCPNAAWMRNRYPYRSMEAQWSKPAEGTYFIATIKVSGFDQLGILSSITNLISNDLKMDVRNISLESKGGKFDGTIKVSIRDKKHLDLLIQKLLTIKGIIRASRLSTTK